MNYLFKTGGENLVSAVRRIMSQILSNDLAEQCNMKGVGLKRALEKTRLLRAVKGECVFLYAINPFILK